MSQYIEVNVSEGANSPMTVNRMFSVAKKPKPVRAVWASLPSGADAWCEVVGWSGDGACQAYAATVEDSGDGTALLVYGGDDGIRLKPEGHASPWSLATRDQWGEPCLLLPTDTEVR
jgi:hypothetical protein